MTKKIALLGGSFNPPHQGHIHISKEALKKLQVQQVWWVPTKQNPLKKLQNPSFDLRFKKCQEITKNFNKIKVTSYEKQIKSCLTIDLINYLQQKYPDIEFYFIMGADNLIEFHLWDFWQDIIKKVNLVIFSRGHFIHQSIRSKSWLFGQKYNCRFLHIKKYNISSTEIRKHQKFLKNY